MSTTSRQSSSGSKNSFKAKSRLKKKTIAKKPQATDGQRHRHPQAKKSIIKNKNPISFSSSKRKRTVIKSAAGRNRARRTLSSPRHAKNQKIRRRSAFQNFLIIIVSGVLLMLVLVLCGRYLLPHLFPLEESRNILIFPAINDSSDSNLINIASSSVSSSIVPATSLATPATSLATPATSLATSTAPALDSNSSLSSTSAQLPILLLNFNPEINKITRVVIDPIWWQNKLDTAQILSYLPDNAAVNTEIEQKHILSPERANLGFYSLILGEAIDQTLILDLTEANSFHHYLDHATTDCQFDYQTAPLLSTNQNIANYLRHLWWQELYQSGHLNWDLLELDLFARSQASYYLNNFVLNSETEAKWDNDFTLAKTPHLDCSLVVVNSTSTAGLANKLASLWQNDGWVVTRTGNYQDDELEKTTVYYQKGPSTCQDLLERSSRLLPITPQLIEDNSLANQYRAQVVVVIGQDLADF